MNIKNKRDYEVDVLRVLGIFLIILAHTSLKEKTNTLLFNLRNFDVVLLVFLSGLSSVHSLENVNSMGQYIEYITKRIRRLIIPGFSFITIYYLYIAIMNCFWQNPYH